MTEPLRIAVVGHTNTGKTSLMRTLLRDADFGEVSTRPSTTRHVEGASLRVDGEPLVQLFDTPGMEDAIALLEYMEGLQRPGERLDGPERVERFLGSAEAGGRFEQEAKVLRQLLASDAGFYVVDARDPVLAKHRDELTILAMCARPLLPVLNFVARPESREAAWRESLARLGLHAQVRFDTVAPELGGERRLYESLATLMHAQRERLERLVSAREREAGRRRESAARLVADLLVDAAACRRGVPEGPADGIAREVARLHRDLRRREQACVDELLRLYRFRPGDVRAAELPLLDGRWEQDLFSGELMRTLGIKVSKGAAAGAAVGVGIDLMTGGLTLGAAAALGALAGGAVQAAQQLGGRLAGLLTGQRELTVDDAIVRVLATRQQSLLRALEGRGHAALDPIELANPEVSRWRERPLPQAIARARAHPEWSSLEGAGYAESPSREEAVASLAAALAAVASATETKALSPDRDKPGGELF